MVPTGLTHRASWGKVGRVAEGRFLVVLRMPDTLYALEVAGNVIIGRVLTRPPGPSPTAPPPRQPDDRPHPRRRHTTRASSAS